MCCDQKSYGEAWQIKFWSPQNSIISNTCKWSPCSEQGGFPGIYRRWRLPWPWTFIPTTSNKAHGPKGHIVLNCSSLYLLALLFPLDWRKPWAKRYKPRPSGPLLWSGLSLVAPIPASRPPESLPVSRDGSARPNTTPIPHQDKHGHPIPDPTSATNTRTRHKHHSWMVIPHHKDHSWKRRNRRMSPGGSPDWWGQPGTLGATHRKTTQNTQIYKNCLTWL